MPDITHVLSEKYKGMDWSLNGSPTTEAEFTEGFTIHKANGVTAPTWANLETQLVEMQAEYDAKEYRRKREPEYPTIGDQLDLLWHAIDDGTLDKTSDFYTSLKATKDKYPKSS
jgi:hypothetical protein